MKYTPFNVLRYRNSWEIAPRAPAVAAIGAAIGGASFMGLTGLAAIGAYVGVSLVTSWALSALAPKPDLGSTTSSGLLVNQKDAIAPHDFVYGEVRKGGIITYYETTGTNNKFLHQIIVLAGHEVDSIPDIYINDEVVDIGADEFRYEVSKLGFGLVERYVLIVPASFDYAVDDILTDEQFQELRDNALSEEIYYYFPLQGAVFLKPTVTKKDDVSGSVTSAPWNSKIRIKKHLGTADQAADADLLAESNQIDSSFRGRGMAYLYVRYEYDQDVFANGLPLITAVVRGKKVFDPRTSTTAWSNNAALCVRDYLTSSYGLKDDQIDEIDFSSAANICDEAVTLAEGGTEKRYTINGVVRADQTHGNVLQDMMTACAGSLFWGAGKWKLRVADYVAPVKTLTLDDLRGPISLSTRVNLQDQFNGVQGTFNDAASRWITTEYPPLNSAAFEAEDGGEQTMLDLALPFTTSAATAQRLAKLTLFRGREQMTLTADFGLNAFDVEVGEIIAFTNPRYGWVEKEFEVVGWSFGAAEAGDLRVTLTLRETSEAAFDWDAEESEIIGNNTSLPDAFGGLTVTGLSASSGGSTQGDGTFINSVLLDWDDVDNAFLDHYEVEWKPLADSVYSATTTAQSDIEISPLIDGVEYIFRIRAVSVAGIKGLWESVQFTGSGDTTAPNPVTNLSADAGYKQITLRFDPPTNSDFNRVEIFESTTNDFESASSIGFSSGSRFVRAGLENYVTRYYWVRSLDFSGNASSVVGPVSATTLLIEEVDLSAALVETIERAGVAAVNSLPASGDFVGQLVFLLTDNTLYQWDGAAWSTQLYTDIKDDSVTTDKIAASAIVATKIAAGAVTANKMAVDSITAENGAIANLSVDRIKIANGAVTNVYATQPVFNYSSQYNDGLYSVETTPQASKDAGTWPTSGHTITNEYYNVPSNDADAPAFLFFDNAPNMTPTAYISGTPTGNIRCAHCVIVYVNGVEKLFGYMFSKYNFYIGGRMTDSLAVSRGEGSGFLEKGVDYFPGDSVQFRYCMWKYRSTTSLGVSVAQTSEYTTWTEVFK